jgi:uncharacterized protein YjbI with pentapeptide repeats
MADEEQVKILKQGLHEWEQWRSENIEIKDGFSTGKYKMSADLSGADLRHMDLNGVDFHGANLRGTNLSGSNLARADFIEADLTNAKLNNTKLFDAEFYGATLIGAELKKAELLRTNFVYANLSKANLARSVLETTFFVSTSLAKAKQLESCLHEAPSIIDHNTLAKSGILPALFLRGCGLSDIQIEFARLASPGLDSEQVTDIAYRIQQLYLGSGIQYYSCFISYSSKDEKFAQRLHDDLQNSGVRCWFDREDMKIGDPLRPTIDRQIRLRDKLLVILSENSVRSEWVGDEVEAALEEEDKSNRLVLFPIRLDNAVLNTRDDWAAKIKRRRHIGDFSNWKDKRHYQKAFERLLRDLKATERGGNGQ